MRQDQALDILKTGANALLTGEPGSGKTHTVNAYVAWLRSHGIEPALTASTGIAATHIGGMTIHAWSGIGIRSSLSPADVEMIAGKEHVARRLNKTQVLIIDEVSMLSGQTLAMVDQVLREARRSERAFGGMQAVLVGDFFQLPPVSRSGMPEFAFESDAFRALNPLPLYLSEQHRHDDRALESILANMRTGRADESDVSRLHTREAEEEGLDDSIPRLFTHNADVDRINDEKLRALPGNAESFAMNSSGAPALIESLKRGCLSPERLFLKEGAAVMFTKNNPMSGYSNGTLGVVRGFEAGTKYPVVETRDGRRLTVAPQEWAVEENGKVRAKVAQIPLRLAWAITIHKSQGQSLDAAAIDLSRAFEYGQGYVALSRLRKLDGLHLLGWNEQALAMHPLVAERDAQFRSASEEAAEAFTELAVSGERAKLEERFIRAVGGTLEASEGGRAPKKSTYEETLDLLSEGKSLTEIAKERDLTFGTIVSHLEKLKESGRITEREIRAIAPERILAGLPEIEAAFKKSGTMKALTPAFKRLKGAYTFDELKLARALLSGREE